VLIVKILSVGIAVVGMLNVSNAESRCVLIALLGVLYVCAVGRIFARIVTSGIST